MQQQPQLRSRGTAPPPTSGGSIVVAVVQLAQPSTDDATPRRRWLGHRSASGRLPAPQRRGTIIWRLHTTVSAPSSITCRSRHTLSLTSWQCAAVSHHGCTAAGTFEPARGSPCRVQRNLREPRQLLCAHSGRVDAVPSRAPDEQWTTVRGSALTAVPSRLRLEHTSLSLSLNVQVIP